MTAVRSVFDYFFGLAIVGALLWLTKGILVELQPFALEGDVLTYVDFLWPTGAIIIYLVAGAFWLPRVMKEWKGGNIQ